MTDVEYCRFISHAFNLEAKVRAAHALTLAEADSTSQTHLVYNRPVAKPTISEDFLEDTETLVSERRTAVYSVHEDSSTGSTTKIPDRGRLRNWSNEEEGEAICASGATTDEDTAQIAKFLEDARSKNKRVVVFEDEPCSRIGANLKIMLKSEVGFQFVYYFEQARCKFQRADAMTII